MIEILNFFFLLFVLCCFYFLPFKKVLLLHQGKKEKENYFESISINVVYILNFFIFFSFFSINQINIFFLLLFLFFVSLFLKKNNFKFFINYNFLIFFIFSTTYCLQIVSEPELTWDAASHWIFKVINFYENQSFFNLSEVPGTNSYPHIGTYVWSFFWKISLIDNEYTGRLFFIIFFFLVIFTVISSYNYPKIKFTLICFTISFFTFDSFLFSGYQEPLMFSLVLLAAHLFLIEKKNQKNFKYFFINILIFSNLIIWTKNEGMFIIFFLFIFFVFDKKISLKKKIIIFLGITALVSLKSYIFYKTFPSGNLGLGWNGYKFLIFSDFDFLLFCNKVFFIFKNLFISYFKYPIYIIFILLSVYSLIKKIQVKFLKETIVYFILSNLFCVAIFLLNAEIDWKFKTEVGLDRVLYQFSSIYLIFIMEFIKKNRSIIKI